MDAANQLLTAISKWAGVSENRILAGFVLFFLLAILSAVIKSILRVGILLLIAYVGYVIYTVR